MRRFPCPFVALFFVPGCLACPVSMGMSVCGLRPCVATNCWTWPEMSQTRGVVFTPADNGRGKDILIPMPTSYFQSQSRSPGIIQTPGARSINHVTWPSGNRVLTEMQMGLGLIKFQKQSKILGKGCGATENNARQQIKLSIWFLVKLVKIVWQPLFNASTCLSMVPD